MKISEMEEIDFEQDGWEKELLSRLKSYPKLHDPVFQKYLDTIENIKIGEELFELTLLELIADGIIEVESVSDDGQVTFKNPVLQ